MESFNRNRNRESDNSFATSYLQNTLSKPKAFILKVSGNVVKKSRMNFEVRHPRCVGSITKNFCVLHIQSNTTIFQLAVQ